MALTLLCDLAHHPSASVQAALWRHDALGLYLGLLPQPYWQVRTWNGDEERKSVYVWLA